MTEPKKQDEEEIRDKFRRLLNEIDEPANRDSESIDLIKMDSSDDVADKNITEDSEPSRSWYLDDDVFSSIPKSTGHTQHDDALDLEKFANLEADSSGDQSENISKTRGQEISENLSTIPLEEEHILGGPLTEVVEEIDFQDHPGGEINNYSPPPLMGSTPHSIPSVDENGMALPKSFEPSDQLLGKVTKPINRDYPEISKPVFADRKKRKRRLYDRVNINLQSLKGGLGCGLRMVIIALFIIIIVTIPIGSFIVFKYYTIANDLPTVADLRLRASQFETTRILDRNGNTLYEILDPTAGRRSYVSLNDISPYLIAATIATEDKEFYSHPGFDPMAILRAFWFNLRGGEISSGASTITQQLARLLLFTPEERSERSYMRKVNEAILAAEITRRYSKDEIIELYINEIYYGNLSYGIEAAAQVYFGSSANKLTLSQAAFLAGLPQAPSVYDVFTNRDVTLHRQQDVLLLMFRASEEQGCIYVSNNSQPICVDVTSATKAAVQMEEYEFQPQVGEIRYPHWVTYVRSLLESQFDPQTIYRSGFVVYTTIDPGLQESAEKIVRENVEKLSDRHVNGGALVAIRPSNGEILAMVGSPDFFGTGEQSQINMAIIPRQPGSSIKPLTYLASFEKGWTPSTLIWDVPSEFSPSGDPNDPRPPYIPVNYDEYFHGPVRLRSALANSYNIPAVKALEFVRIFDDPATPKEDGLIEMAKRLGITSLTRNDYGLSLTLGGGEVSLLEMTAAYSVIANGGRFTPVVAIKRIDDHLGNLIYEYDTSEGEQVIRPEHAFLISSILSDNNARTPGFGANSVLNLSFNAAAKTGTTNDFRDNWTVGYTPDLSVGVWVGNPDYTPMENTSGLTGAAPIWAEFMELSVNQITGNNPGNFVKPSGIVEKSICTLSGTEPSIWCPSQMNEYFAADQLPPLKGYDIWQKAMVDTWTNLLASSDCSDYNESRFSLNVTDKWAIQWLNGSSQGKSWTKSNGFTDPVFFTPIHACTNDDSRPLLEFSFPLDGSIIEKNPVRIVVQADATSDFYQYIIEYGLGNDPDEWNQIYKKKIPVGDPQEITSWDISDVPSGAVTLRLYIKSTRDTYAETRIQIELQLPTPTATATSTPTATPTSTLTFTPTFTPTPTFTASVTQTPLDTSTLTSIPVFTLEPTPTLTPSPTPNPPPTHTLTPTP